jgi:hypothetical protein
MHTNGKKNLDFPFTEGTLVTFQELSWFPLQKCVVTKATFYHGHSGLEDRWSLELVDLETGKKVVTNNRMVDPVVG